MCNGKYGEKYGMHRGCLHLMFCSICSKVAWLFSCYASFHDAQFPRRDNTQLCTKGEGSVRKQWNRTRIRVDKEYVLS